MMFDSLELLDRQRAAALLGVSDRTLDRITDIPRVRLSARRVAYRRADLERYVEQRTETRSAA